MSAWSWPWTRKVIHKCGGSIWADEDPCSYCDERLTDHVLHGCGAEVWTDSVCWNACGAAVIPFQTC
jgi:hypothetical protein